MLLRSLIRGIYHCLAPASQGLRVRSDLECSRDALTLETGGLPGHHDVLSFGQGKSNPIDGAQLRSDGSIEETFPAASGATKHKSRR